MMNEETKEKLSISVSKTLKEIYREGDTKMGFQEGNIPWNKGKTHSDKTKKKLSDAGKGRLAWNKGLTKETDDRVMKNAISIKEKYSDGKHPMLGKSWEEIATVNGANLRHKKTIGQKRTKITKSNISKSIKKHIKSQYLKFPIISKFEKPILDNLERCFGYKISRQYKIVTNKKRYYLDGYCPMLNLAIDIHEPHHYKNNNVKIKNEIREKNIINALRCKFLIIDVPLKIYKGWTNG